MNVAITGAAGGLGRALAVECARRGYHLFLTDVDDAALRCIQTGLERRFGTAVTAQACDLTDSAGVDAMLRALDGGHMWFDMLLNVAGMDCEGAFLRREREALVRVVTLNDAATLRITHAILERRRQGGRFSLVFVSRMASLFPMPLKATHAASKRFLLDLATALRRELKGQRVDVLALCPAGLATNDEAVAAIDAQGVLGDLTTIPLERVAHRTVTLALRGRARYVPGALNRAVCAIGRLVPRDWAAAAVYRRWRGAQQKWLEGEGAH